MRVRCTRGAPLAPCLKQLFLLVLFSALATKGLMAVGTAFLSGKVVTISKGQPVSAAEITLFRSGDIVGKVRSNDRGSFQIPSLEAGEYELEGRAQGHLPIRYRFSLSPRQVLSLTLELTPRPSSREYLEVVASAEVDAVGTGSTRHLTQQDLQSLPSSSTRDIPTLAENLLPGALLGHDNFVHVRGNELSLHQYINGVAFLDNSHQHFSAGLSPRLFESVNFITGGFPAEFGNRFGGVLDTTTRSSGGLAGHGSLEMGIGTGLHHDGLFEYGGTAGRWGYYFLGNGFESGRFLNPPTEREINDLGYGSSATAQLDYQGDSDSVKLFLNGGGTNFQLPNTQEEAEHGRDAFRRIRSQTAILNWQHTFSARTTLNSAFYERNVSDRLLASTDPVTPLGEGSRSTLATGAKADMLLFRSGHTVKVGLDVSALRLRESFLFDSRDHGEGEPHPEEQHPSEGDSHGEQGSGVRLSRRLGPTQPGGRPYSFSSGSVDNLFFRSRDLGGQVSLYIQDQFPPLPHLNLSAGLRWDQANLVDSFHQVSPRVGMGYHLAGTGATVHFAYNRFFTPPPLEYALLASYLGNEAAEAEREEGHTDVLLGNVQSYTQDYYEVGWSQRIHKQLTLELNTYHHRGKNAFETAEISNTRLFLPLNFHRARASGAELSLRLRQIQSLGLSGHLQYAVGRVHFFGPASGGFPGEELEAGERILPAFDQTHTGTASLFHHSSWRNFWVGVNLRYGSGTPAEEETEVHGQHVVRILRLPQHLTADLATNVTLWEEESNRLELEFSVTNLSDNIYRIAKESEATPFQFAPRRVVAGRLKWHF